MSSGWSSADGLRMALLGDFDGRGGGGGSCAAAAVGVVRAADRYAPAVPVFDGYCGGVQRRWPACSRRGGHRWCRRWWLSGMMRVPSGGRSLGGCRGLLQDAPGETAVLEGVVMTEFVEATTERRHVPAGSGSGAAEPGARFANRVRTGAGEGRPKDRICVWRRCPRAARFAVCPPTGF